MEPDTPWSGRTGERLTRLKVAPMGPPRYTARELNHDDTTVTTKEEET